MASKTLNDLLNWRYATKKMDPAKTVPEDKVDAIIEAIRMAPTSSGIQPFEVFVVTNTDLREKLSEAAMGQMQIVEGSHVLVFAAWDNYTEARIDEVVNLNVDARGDLPMLHAYYDNLKEMLLPRPPEVNHGHAARQAYIALGVGLVAAAEQEVDCSPMEGFSPDAVDEILGLKEKGLRSVVLMTLGYRDADNDWLLTMDKVRKPRDMMFTRVD